MKRSRIKRKNPERAAQRLAENFGPQAALCRLLPCFACGMGPPSDPDHHPTRGAGGKDPNTLPLCRRCHDRRGSAGVVTFQRQWLVDMDLATRVLAAIVRRAFRRGDGWRPDGKPPRTEVNGWDRPPGRVIDEAADALAAIRGGGDV